MTILKFCCDAACHTDSSATADLKLLVVNVFDHYVLCNMMYFVCEQTWHYYLWLFHVLCYSNCDCCRVAVHAKVLGVVQKTNNTSCLGIQGQVYWHIE